MEHQSLDELYVENVQRFARTHNRQYLSKKELAACICVGPGKIDQDYRSGLIPGVTKMGPEGSRAEVRIAVWGAVEYICRCFHSE